VAGTAGGGILSADDATDAARRRFSLPSGHDEVLLDGDSLSFLAPLGSGVVSLAQTLPKVLDAFRSGGGVSFDAYGPDIRHFISRINRPMFINLLASDWFPKVPGLVERLQAAPPARVADVGCGTGWSSIAIALGFQGVEVVGLDLDEASVAEARANAEASGVADRIVFQQRDAADPSLGGGFDLVCAFETIHDMCDPVGALRAMRSLGGEHGTVLIADERVADSFTVEADDTERFQYGWSALHCLPTALTDLQPRDRDHHADADAPELRPGGRLCGCGRTSDRKRLLAVLPARGLTVTLPSRAYQRELFSRQIATLI
jgi:SAM-dependent methyltransferase